MSNTSSEAHQNNNPLDALQKIRPDLLGFVFQLSWLYLLLYDSAITNSSTHSSTANVLYISSALPLIITLAIGIATSHKFQTFAEGRLGVYGAPIITALGTIFYCVNLLGPSLLFVILGGVLTGIGSAVLAVRWATAFGRATPREILENFPFQLAIVFVICVSSLYTPLILRCILVIILPILSGASLQYAKHYAGTIHQSSRKHIANALTTLPTWAKGPGIALLCIALIALIGFNAGLLASFEIGSINYAALFYITTAVLVLGFVGTLLFQMSRQSMLLIFGLPLAIIVITLLPFAQFLVSSPADALPSIGNIALELTLLSGCVLFALVTDRAVGKTFMISRCTMAISDLLGSFIGDQLATFGDSQWTLQVAAVCLLLAVELLLLSLIAGYFSIRRIQKNRRESQAMTQEAKPTLGDNPEASYSDEAALSHITDNTLVGEASPVAAKGSGSTSHPAEEIISTNEVNPDSETLEKSGSLDERIAAIASEYGLSARERDVFTLLAKGRSAARIQEDLCIAAGTVNYHTRNIYAKLGVHNRQQIIDLLEDE